MSCRSLLFALTFGAVIPAGGAAAAPPTEPPAAGPVPFELVGVVAQPEQINLQPGWPVRVDGPDDRAGLDDLLATGADARFAADVTDLIDERFPDDVPAGTTLLVGHVHQGCFPPAEVVVERQPSGHLALLGVPDEREATVLCAVSLASVAVVAVPAETAPAGSTGAAELVAFTSLGSGATELLAVELDAGNPDALPVPVDLPPLEKHWRRFAFVRPGCSHTTAEIVVTPALIDATLERAPGAFEYDCEVPEWFLAVFDVPTAAIDADATLAGAVAADR